MNEYELLIDEALDRLWEGIAEDVEDVVGQLLDEGLCIRGVEDGALRNDLRRKGWA